MEEELRPGKRRSREYRSRRGPADAELLAGITRPKSRFGKACAKLGAEVIAANSLQAKGRVERGHGLGQYRLAKELRLAGISTIHEAGRFLRETCLPGEFSRPAASREDARIPLLGVTLTDIFIRADGIQRLYGTL
jgi:hypothetical protein